MWSVEGKRHDRAGSYQAERFWLLLHGFVCFPAKPMYHEVTDSSEKIKLLRIIKNETTFEEKYQRSLQIIHFSVQDP